VFAQAGGADAEARQMVVELLRSLISDLERPLTGASVAWLHGDGRVSRAWAGWRTIAADHPASSLPLDANSLFRVASVSKLALALAALRLDEARTIDLDADISTLLRHNLRHPRHPQTPITPRLLLSHRSGLQDARLPVADGDALRRLLSNPASWGTDEPGRQFRYSNLGYVVLATAMEAAARQPFDALMQRWLFDPLGISARYSPQALSGTQRDQLATLYRKTDRQPQWQAQFDARGDAPHPFATPAALSAMGENASVHSPHGGLRSSVPDLCRLARLLMQQGRWEGRRVLSASSLAQLQRAHWTHGPDSPGDTADGLMRSWGLGCQRFIDVSDARGGDRLHSRGGIRAYGHLGSAYGLYSGLLYHPGDTPDNGWSLVYVINGTSQGAQESGGRHSSLRRFEERLIETLLDTVLPPREAARLSASTVGELPAPR
jgi:CubicO group peptidase (beta-lactamase class C family)